MKEMRCALSSLRKHAPEPKKNYASATKVGAILDMLNKMDVSVSVFLTV